MTSIKILFLATLLVTVKKNTIVNGCTGHRDFTVGTSDSNLMTNENTVNVKYLERCFNERIDRDMSNIVDTSKTESKTQFDR